MPTGRSGTRCIDHDLAPEVELRIPVSRLVSVVVVLTGAGWSMAPGAGATSPAPTPQVFRFNSGSDDRALAQAVDAAGNSYLAGSVHTAGNPVTFSVVKLDPRGRLVWRHTYSGSRGGILGQAAAVALDAAGNVFAAGSIADSSNAQNVLVLKLGPDGTEQWAQRTSTGGGLDFAVRIALGPAGEVYVGGDSIGTGMDWLTQQYGPDGTLRWSRRFSGPGADADQLIDMAVTPSGNLAVTGMAELTGDGITNDIVTLEYDPQGATVWQRQFSDTAISDDLPADLEVDPAGTVVVTGVSNRNASPENTVMGPVTLRYDAAGTPLPVIRSGGAAVHLDQAGTIYLAGSINQEPGNSTVSKFSPSGAQIWTTPLPLAAGDLLTVAGIVVDPAGTITLAGTVDNQPTVNRDYLTLRYSPAGQELWRQRFDGHGQTKEDTVAGIALTGASTVLVAGTSSSPTLSAREDMVELRFP
jgi:hypothetical protein